MTPGEVGCRRDRITLSAQLCDLVTIQGQHAAGGEPIPEFGGQGG